MLWPPPELKPMAASRLNDSQKRELVQRYRSGEATSALSRFFGCSPNTVSRIVKAILPDDEYQALKSHRAKGGGHNSVEDLHHQKQVIANEAHKAAAKSSGIDPDELDLGDAGSGPLALDDADDFGNDSEVDESASGDLDFQSDEEPSLETFHVIPTLETSCDLQEPQPLSCQPLAPGVLPDSAYLLVDKVVELDPRPLRDYPELGHLTTEDQERQSLYLFSNPRAAKRQCGRGQRVIKVPDTAVFECSAPYLLARGITRLVIEGTLVSLDQ